jgi:hypothetical protein
MDKRLATRGDLLLERLSRHQQCSLRQLSCGHTEEMGFYRYLSNDAVSESGLVEAACLRTNAAITGGHALVLGDSTALDYSRHHRRVKSGTGLGYIGDHGGLGYNAHVNLVIDAQSEAVYGLGHIRLWHRAQMHSGYSQLYRGERERSRLRTQLHNLQKQGKRLSKADAARLAELEALEVLIDGVTYTRSYDVPAVHHEGTRWQEGCRQTRRMLPGAQVLTYVHDREGDIYGTFAQIPDAANHLLIRSRVNRLVIIGSELEPDTGQNNARHQVKLHQYQRQLPELGQITVTVRDRDSGKARKAMLALKSARIRLTHGTAHAAYERAYPATIAVGVVYAEEQPQTVPPGADPISWCLLTTHDVSSLAQAVQITHWYCLRWHIELLFRLIKTEGFDLESSELETGYALRKLGILTMQAAIQVHQLKQAREGDTTLPIEAVFSEAEVACLTALLPTIEGKTAKQANPFAPQSLPWATWIIARLGGWNGYKNDRPPGILTLTNGLERFKNIFIGFYILND